MISLRSYILQILSLRSLALAGYTSTPKGGFLVNLLVKSNYSGFSEGRSNYFISKSTAMERGGWRGVS
jgi:hypothetical protein